MPCEMTPIQTESGKQPHLWKIQ